MSYVTIIYPTAIAWDSRTGERITGPEFEEFKRRTAAALKRSMRINGQEIEEAERCGVPAGPDA